MGCMKCGRDLEDGQVFCESCLAVMSLDPVKPGTPVNLPPPREESARRSTPRKKTVPLEEQVRRLRKLNRRLSFLLALLVVLTIFLGYFTVQHLMEEEGFLPGQNYSSMDESSQPTKE